MLSRTVFAARYTLFTALVGVVLTLGLGTVLGIAAGLLGGLWDRIVMRTSELFMALPAIYLILALRNLFPDALDPLESGAWSWSLSPRSDGQEWRGWFEGKCC